MSKRREPVIAASILAADFSDLGTGCRAATEAGAEWVHLDVMDGHFVPNITFGPAVCAALRPHIDGVMDVHLMIEPVDPLLGAFCDSGADIVTVHAEACTHLHRTLEAIGDRGAKAGVALNPGTPASSIQEVADFVDLICIMTVNPGFGGQRFIPSQLAKIREVLNMIEDRPIKVQVDGGIAPDTAPMVTATGANVLVAGSAVFGKANGDSGKIAKNIEALRQAARKGIR